MCRPFPVHITARTNSLQSSSDPPTEMASRIVWIKVGGAKPAPYEGSLDVFPSVLILALAQADMFRESVRAAPLNEWGVHILHSYSSPPDAENEVPFDTKVSTRTGAGDVFIHVYREPDVGACCTSLWTRVFGTDAPRPSSPLPLHPISPLPRAAPPWGPLPPPSCLRLLYCSICPLQAQEAALVAHRLPPRLQEQVRPPISLSCVPPVCCGPVWPRQRRDAQALRPAVRRLGTVCSGQRGRGPVLSRPC